MLRRDVPAAYWALLGRLIVRQFTNEKRRHLRPAF
jgi:hypothetical protein